MLTQASPNHEAIIAAAMTIAERNGYLTGAWRLFEAEAKTTLTAMSGDAPSLAPEHHEQFDDTQLEHTKSG
jgi:hypothetical protein